ncbi:MAG: hypothetical protein R2702_03235 [Acidimicrobiales bacterium]
MHRAADRRRPLRRAVLGSAAVALALLAGCSTEAPGRDEIARSLRASGFSVEAADCAADALVDNLSDDQIAELAERGGGGAPVDDPNRTDDPADKVREAMNACRPLVEGTTTTTTPQEGATTTTLAPDEGGAGGGAAIDSAPSTTEP